MKVNNNRHVITSMTNTHDFKFNASPQLFKILSDSLYSNKVSSIIRELASNCIDAHRRVGKENIPFDVYLPSKGILATTGATFSIRDYGPGLSHDDMLNIYTTYCLSTKTDSNDYIGAFGIGSKSPFAYTDSFTIISIYNKIKTTYTAFINDKGYPTLATLDSHDTDEDSGLMVSIPVEEKDITEFCNAIKTQLSRFVVLPNIIDNENFFDIQHTELYYKLKQVDSKKNDMMHIKFTDESTYTLVSYARSSQAGTYNITLIIAGICYYLSYDNLRDKCKFPITISFIKRHSLELYLNIGDIDLTASREDIAYTEKTISLILNRLKYVYKDVFANIEKISTLWEKRIAYNMLFDNNNIHNSITPINDFLDIDVNTLQNKIVFNDIFDMNIVSLCELNYFSYARAKRKNANMDNVLYPNKLTRIILSPKLISAHVYKNIYDLYYKDDNIVYNVVVIFPKKRLIKKQDIIDFMEYAHNICAKYDIPVIEYVPVSCNTQYSNKYDNTLIKYFTPKEVLFGDTITITYNSITKTKYYDDIKLSDTCVYILSDKRKLIFNNSFLKFSTFNILKYYNILFGNIETIVVLSKTQFKMLEKQYTNIQQFSFNTAILKNAKKYYIKNRINCISCAHLYNVEYYIKFHEIAKSYLEKNNNVHSPILKLLYKLYYARAHIHMTTLLNELNICKINRNTVLSENINKYIIKHRKLLYVINKLGSNLDEMSQKYVLEYIIGE